MALTTPIDPRRLQEYSGGDLEFEQELLELFITDAEQHLQGIEEAVAHVISLEEANSKERNISQSLEIIRQEAHHLKGASGNIGAYSFQAIATQLEQDAKHGIRASYASQLSHLKQAFAEVITQVRQWPSPNAKEGNKLRQTTTMDARGTLYNQSKDVGDTNR